MVQEIAPCFIRIQLCIQTLIAIRTGNLGEGNLNKRIDNDGRISNRRDINVLIDGLIVRTWRRRRKMEETNGHYMKVCVINIKRDCLRVYVGVS
jgi:hypothetical protein